MRFVIVSRLVVALLALSFFAGCERQTAQSTAVPTAAVLPAEHRFPIKIGDQTVQMRLAVHQPERTRGLMYVTAMPEDEGMLFVWDRTQRMSFYMRNTRIPLDIGYIDPAGVLREIYPMYPGMEDPVVSRADTLQFALEMNREWYARHGVTPGASLDLVALRDALRARGLDPDLYVRPP